MGIWLNGPARERCDVAFFVRWFDNRLNGNVCSVVDGNLLVHVLC